MSDLRIEIRDVDRNRYEERIREFLPPRIWDVHTHIWEEEKKGRAQSAKDQSGRLVTWPARVASENPVEHLLSTYEQMLPGKDVKPLLFNSPTSGKSFDEMNAYVSDCAQRHGLPWLMMATPDWDSSTLSECLDGYDCLGVKVYLGYASKNLAPDEITIFDFLPPWQLEVLNERGSLVMLHIPRSGRLGDPVNLEQMITIERDYPNVKVIIAHVGRAYCEEDVGDAFHVLSESERMLFDISANTNAAVFKGLLACVGPQRVLFGTDLPIARMRMRRICEEGRYINIVPPGLYGDVSYDPHMREAGEVDGQKLSFFLYEIIDAFREAAEDVGLSAQDIEDVFFGNAERLLSAESSL